MFESLSWWYGWFGYILWDILREWFNVWLVVGGLLLALFAGLLVTDFRDSRVGKIKPIGKRFSRWLTGGLIVGGFLFLLMVAGVVVSAIHYFQDHRFSAHTIIPEILEAALESAPFVLGCFVSEFVPFWLYWLLWRRILQREWVRCQRAFLESIIAGGLIGIGLILAFAPMPLGAVEAFLALISRHEEMWIVFLMFGIPVPFAACFAAIGMLLGLSFAAIFVLVATGWQWLRANGRSAGTTA